MNKLPKFQLILRILRRVSNLYSNKSIPYIIEATVRLRNFKNIERKNKKNKWDVSTARKKYIQMIYIIKLYMLLDETH